MKSVEPRRIFTGQSDLKGYRDKGYKASSDKGRGR